MSACIRSFEHSGSSAFFICLSFLLISIRNFKKHIYFFCFFNMLKNLVSLGIFFAVLLLPQDTFLIGGGRGVRNEKTNFTSFFRGFYPDVFPGSKFVCTGGKVPALNH